jgi:hypothetical protein
MSPGENRRENPIDYLFLTHNPLGHLRPKVVYGTHQPLELLDVVVRAGLGGGHEASLESMSEIYLGREIDASMAAASGFRLWAIAIRYPLSAIGYRLSAFGHVGLGG